MIRLTRTFQTSKKDRFLSVLLFCNGWFGLDQNHRFDCLPAEEQGIVMINKVSQAHGQAGGKEALTDCSKSL